MDTFKQYLSDTGHTIGSFAKCVGISQNYMSEIASFDKTPSLAVAVKIHLASGKVVPIEHWLNPPNEGLTREAS